MEIDELRPGVHWVGAIDRERRSFDELVPIPAGTTYNAYLVRGAERTALIDTVEPEHAGTLLARLEALGVGRLDYLVSNHTEQDHSGAIPAVLARFPAAQVLATPRAQELLVDHLALDPGRIAAVEDGARLPLGGKTLRFLHFPWVHWPETMLTYLEEDRALFPCDLFGAHLAGPAPILDGDARLPEEARRYYACILMPYRESIAAGLRRLEELPLDLIAPSHGAVHTAPRAILEAYRAWVGDPPRNLAVLPYVSMHGSTRRLVLELAGALEARGVEARPLDLADPDLGKLAVATIDAATLVLGAPAVLGRLHPKAAAAALLVAALRPKLRWLALVGSYGWGASMAEQLRQLLDLEAEHLAPVLVKGAPREEDLAAVGRLAEEIARRHQGLSGPVATPPPAAPAAPAVAGVEMGPRYRCKPCGWIYDPAVGDPRSGIAPGTPFAALPETWRCPLCDEPKRRFKAIPPA
jgi:flavorubredoxin/rubredoxin